MEPKECDMCGLIHAYSCREYIEGLRMDLGKLVLQVGDYRAALHTILGEAANSDEMVGVAQRVLAKYGDVVDSRIKEPVCEEPVRDITDEYEDCGNPLPCPTHTKERNDDPNDQPDKTGTFLK